MKDPSETKSIPVKEASCPKQQSKDPEIFQTTNDKEEAAMWANGHIGHAFFELAPDSMAIAGFNSGCMIDVNRAFVEWSHYSRDESMGRTLEDLGFWVDKESKNEIFDRLNKTGSVKDVEVKVRTGDGELRCITFSGRLVGDNDDRWLLFVAHDITERKRAREELLESEDKYRTLVEDALAGVFLHQDGLFRFVNKRWCEIYGYTFEETVDTMGPLDIIHPEDRHISEENTRKARAGEFNPVRYTHKAVKKDGTIIRVHVLGSPIVYKGRPAIAGTVYDITEQERAQEQLRQKTALLEAQVNVSLDGIIIVDRGKKILENRQFKNLFKIPPFITEVDDDGPRIQWVGHQVKNSEQFYEKVISVFAHPEETMRDEIELLDGTVLDRYSSPVIGKDGVHYGRIWTFRDITERKRSEEALRTSQNKLSEAMDLARIVYWEFDPSVQEYIFNDPFYALYGTTAGEEGGYRMKMADYAKRFVHPDDLALFFRIMEQNIVREGFEPPLDTEHRIIRRDGEVRHMLARTRVAKDSSGRIIGLYGANQDITDRYLAEEALKVSEEKYRKIFEGASEGIYQTAAEGRYLSMNPAFAKMFGYTSPQEMIDSITNIGRQLYVNPKDREEMVRRLHENGKVDGYEVEVYHKDGSRFWISINIHAVCDASGNIIYFEGTNIDITERKRMERELVVSRNRLSKAEIISRCGNWEFDLRSGKVLASDGARRICGMADREWTVAEARAMPLPEYRDHLHEALHRLIDDDIPYDVEYKIRRPDTGEIVDIYSVAEYDRHRNVVFGIMQDITNRKQAEETLHRTNAFLDSIIDNIPDMIFLKDARELRFIRLNRAAEELLGYSKTDLLGKNDYDFFRKEQADFFREKDQETLRRKHTVDIPEERIQTRNHGVRILHTKKVPILNSNGEAEYLLGISEDITARIQAEEEIIREKDKLSTLSENVPFGMVLIDKDGRFTHINGRFLELFGYDLQDVPDYEMWSTKAYPDAEYRQTIRSIRIDDLRSAGRGERISRVFTVTCKDGAHKTVHFTTSMLISGDYLMTCEDITEVRRLESQLRQAQKTEAIGTLAGGIAHDFNNILTALMGYAALIQMKMERSHPLRPYVDQILEGSEKAADLTRSLLAFSRQQSVTFAPLSINNTVGVAEKLLGRLLTEDIELQTDLIDSDTVVMADKSQMDQILFNLVTNARDAMPKGGKLTIKTTLVALDSAYIKAHGFGEAGEYVLLSVSDTGTGMDAVTRQKIFDPFFTTKEVGKGTGLGLATVYGIVKQHNGYIVVESVLNEGTAFHVYLPHVPVEVNASEDTAIPARRGKETILIAEDNEGVRNFLREALQVQGYTIREAVDGEDAIEKFKRYRDMDLVIIDSVMPKKNGREAYEEIRRIDPHVKALFTSGYTKDIVLGKGIEEKDFDFIAKPLSPKTLFQKVREMLDRRREQGNS